MGDWVNIIKGVLGGLISTTTGYLLGRERTQRQIDEQAIQLQKKYEEIDQANKKYHNAGKSGLIDRLQHQTDNNT